MMTYCFVVRSATDASRKLPDNLEPGDVRAIWRIFRVVRLVLDFHDHLDFYAGTVGQRSHANGGPGMGSSLTV